jgi:crotonobetainyl-CoA:carnitine CoA-transferase CaiB-like acyl-CoA transferase
MWQRFCRAIDAEELSTDERFAVLANRYDHRTEMTEEITRRINHLTVSECVKRCDAEGVVCAPVLNLTQVAAEPQVSTLGSIVKVPYGDHEVPVVGSPLHLSETNPTVQTGPPGLGEHTDQVLADLGYDPAQVAQLREKGVVA